MRVVPLRGTLGWNQGRESCLGMARTGFMPIETRGSDPGCQDVRPVDFAEAVGPVGRSAWAQTDRRRRRAAPATTATPIPMRAIEAGSGVSVMVTENEPAPGEPMAAFTVGWV